MRRRHTPRAELDSIYSSPNKGWGGSGGGVEAVFARAAFQLPLNDAGAGIVNIGLNTGGIGTGTFVRASTKWTKLSSGLWASVASGQPCSAYFGMTTAVAPYAGYFPEPAATQLVTPTASIRDMTNAAWTKGATITVAQTGTGIDGVGNSCTRVTGGAVTATNTVLQTLSAAATARTYSCWILRVTGTGAIGIAQDGSTFTDISAQLNSSTFVQVKLTATQLNASFGIQVSTNGDVILVDFNQFEAGTNATSPVDNTGTRAADNLTFVYAGNANTTQGSAYAEMATNWATSPAIMVASSFAASDTIYNLGTPSATGADTMRIRDGTNSPFFSGTNLSTATRKRCSSWGGNGLVIVGDGGAASTTAFDGDIGSVAIGVGCDSSGTRNFSGYIKNHYIWQEQLVTTDMQRITA